MGKQIDLEAMIEEVKAEVDHKTIVKETIEKTMDTGIYMLNCRVGWRKKRGNKSYSNFYKGTSRIPFRIVTSNREDPFSNPITLGSAEKVLGLTGSKYYDLRVVEIYDEKFIGNKSKQAIQQENGQ
jgi:hypothetical protein